jgi:glucokinase
MAAVILAGDVGGTKVHIGLFRIDDGIPRPVRDHRYATRDFSSLEKVCADFLAPNSTTDERILSACFGVPGPIIDGGARPTNVPWKLHEADLSRALGIAQVRLINDLAATAYGVIRLPDSEVCVLQRGEYRLHQADIAIIAAGTGLGEAALVFERGRYYAVASEGGHADFAARNDEQIELYRYLHRRFGHVSAERVLSGPGLFNIYSFLREHRATPGPEWLRTRIEKEDSSAVVSEVALDGRDAECVHALEMFVDIYGAEASNLALKVLALGGVYLGGGIAPKILPALKDGRFIKAFIDKGRLDEILSKIEVRVALNDGAGLIGAAYCAASAL